MSDDLHRRLVARIPETEEMFVSGPPGHWELLGGGLPPVGCDACRDVLAGGIQRCTVCDQFFRLPQEFMAVAVTAEAVNQRSAFVSGWASAVQLFLERETAEGLFKVPRTNDTAHVVSAGDSFDLREVARAFVPAPPNM